MPQLEDQHTEFKRDWNDNAKKTAVAFANSCGGTILLGVDDDGTTPGIANVDDCMLRAGQAIGNGITPSMVRFTQIQTQQRDGKTIVTVHILPGTERPYCLSDKGIRPAGVYVRLGASTVQASQPAILDMIRKASDFPFEDALCVDQNLTFNKSASVFANSKIAFGPNEQQTLGLRDRNGAYTNLAWLLSDQCTASIKAAVFQNTNKSAFTSRNEFTGPLFTQLEQASEFLDRYNSIRSTFDGGLQRHDRRDYEPEVLREALLNLIVHRDYSTRGPGLISIYDDRIEFINFGGLPIGMTKQDMLLGTSLQRNPHLAQIFYRLRLVETYGTGIPRILAAYHGKSQQPDFAVSDNAFKLTLPSRNPITRPQTQPITTPAVPTTRVASHTSDEESETTPSNDSDSRHSLILQQAGRPNGTTSAEIQKLLGLSQQRISTLLHSMVEAGELEKLGNGRNTRYQARH